MSMQTTDIVTPSPTALPDNLPAGARAFQAAVDGMLTTDIWKEILNAQVEKAKSGDRGAAKFLLEYAGGVASLRGATFVQENHHHQHYYEADGKPATAQQPRQIGEQSGISPNQYSAARDRNAQRVAARSGSLK